MTRESVKHDQGKAPLTLVDPDFTEAMARVLLHGDLKYGPANWRTGTGLAYSRVLDAMRRHVAAFERGEDLDPETGQGHMVHAATCAMFLQHYINNDNWEYLDDRHYKGNGAARVPGVQEDTRAHDVRPVSTAQARPDMQTVQQPESTADAEEKQRQIDRMTDRMLRRYNEYLVWPSKHPNCRCTLPPFPVEESLKDQYRRMGLGLQGLNDGTAIVEPLPKEEDPDPLQILQERVTAWADDVYPNRTTEVAFAKMVGEVAEILANPADPLEWADVLILLVDAAHLRGIDILEAAHHKMDINEKRDWAIDSTTGLMSHIKRGI